MYARVATFQGDPANVDEAVEQVRSRVAGDPPAGLAGAKMLMLVNRETGKGLGVTLYESEEAMRRGDEALNALLPAGDGTRVSVEFFEVPVSVTSSQGGRPMTHPNAELLRRGYEAFAKGDIPTVLGLFADDICWHVPGRSPLSGDYKGPQQVLGFFTTGMELSGGTLRVEADEILAEGERVVVLSTVSAERNGQPWSSPGVHLWRVVDGKAVEFREFQGDQQTEDDFWLA